LKTRLSRKAKQARQLKLETKAKRIALRLSGVAGVFKGSEASMRLLTAFAQKVSGALCFWWRNVLCAKQFVCKYIFKVAVVLCS
jgi:hypothetical protein